MSAIFQNSRSRQAHQVSIGLARRPPWAETLPLSSKHILLSWVSACVRIPQDSFCFTTWLQSKQDWKDRNKGRKGVRALFLPGFLVHVTTQPLSLDSPRGFFLHLQPLCLFAHLLLPKMVLPGSLKQESKPEWPSFSEAQMLTLLHSKHQSLAALLPQKPGDQLSTYFRPVSRLGGPDVAETKGLLIHCFVLFCVR